MKKYTLKELQDELDTINTGLKAERNKIRNEIRLIDRVLYDIRYLRKTPEELACDNRIDVSEVLKICKANGVTLEMIEEYQRRRKRDSVIQSIYNTCILNGKPFNTVSDLLKKYNLDAERFDKMLKESDQDTDYSWRRSFANSIMNFELWYYDLDRFLIYLYPFIKKIEINDTIDFNVLKTTMEESKNPFARMYLKFSDLSLKEYCEEMCKLKVV